MNSKTKWISKDWGDPFAPDTQETGCPNPLLRKSFLLLKPVRSAVMDICGLGYGVYYVNGERVTFDVLTTPITKYDATVLYQTYDVTGLLKEGRNAAAVSLGNGWYNNVSAVWNFEKAPWRHFPKLAMALSVTYTDGTTDTMETDASWKTADGPVLFNQSRMGESYDARLETKGWNTAEFDDSGWPNAVICAPPGGVLKRSEMPPIRIMSAIEGREIAAGLFDFGEAISGWCEIETRCESGRKIFLEFAEKLKDGRIDADNINIFGVRPHMDTYTAKGGGWERWEPSFTYHGFRYVQVVNKPDHFRITAKFLHTDLPAAGTFACGNDIINKIHDASVRATLGNWHSIPTDCPHREQNGWTGDALVSADQSMMNFDMLAAYAKWLGDFRDSQRPDGQLPGIVPTGGWGYNWGSGPAWDSALIQIPYLAYKYLGDVSLLIEFWENMVRYMDFLETMSDHYLVGFGLGDWAPPANVRKCPVKLTDTAFYYADAVIMAKCAQLLNRDGREYVVLAENIKAAFRREFVRNGEIAPDCQTALACGIYNKLLEPDEIPRAAKHLAELVEQNGGHIDCGTLGAKWIFDALSDNGYAGVAYRMVSNPTPPSYAYWIGRGMTALCEQWDMESSLFHHMFSEVDMWFYKHLAGIQLDSGKITIFPKMLPELGWVRARHKDIEVYWDSDTLEVTVPREATVILDGEHHTIGKGKWKHARNGGSHAESRGEG